jgi:Zn-dependent peptidase ImmA (M78 family)
MSKSVYDIIKERNLTFNAGWRKYTFKFVKGLKSNGSPCYGEADFDKCIISLDSGVDNDTGRHTVIHEICHVLLETTGLGGHHETKEDWVENTNEYITESMARGMLIFKNLNPELWSVIFDEQSS